MFGPKPELEHIENCYNSVMVRHRQTETGPHNSDLIPSSETAPTLKLGSTFERFISTSADFPEILKDGDIPPAILATNEFLDFRSIKETLGSAPDGLIYGVGAGNLLSLSLLFDPEAPPKAILSVDTYPGAVLVGRIASVGMQECTEFATFCDFLRDSSKLDAAATVIIDAETSAQVTRSLNEIDREVLYSALKSTVRRLPVHGLIESSLYKDKTSVLGAVRKNYAVLRKLAQEGGIGFCLADFFDPVVIRYINGLSEKDSHTNLIYVSNLVDYMGVGNHEDKLDARWSNLKEVMRPLDTAKNIVVFTTIEDDLNLHVSRGLPKQAPNDFWLG